jgi:hypothetical protein
MVCKVYVINQSIKRKDLIAHQLINYVTPMKNIKTIKINLNKPSLNNNKL